MTLAAVLALLAGPMVNVPAVAPIRSAELDTPPDPAQLTLVIADSVAQTDPQRQCEDPRCTSLFLTTWENARSLAGEPLGAEFSARHQMGSPYISRYRLALVVERRADKEPLVRAIRGFNDRTGQACFDDGEWDGLDWHPEAPGIVWRGEIPCVAEVATAERPAGS